MTDLDKRIENQRNIDRIGLGLMDFLNYGDNIRQSDIPFNEPVPGCKYNIGKAWGNVIIPLKEAVMSEFLNKARDYL